MKGLKMHISFFTCGGIFWWIDKFCWNGWRIQQNMWTRRHRLLDPYQICRKWGSFEKCYDALNLYKMDWEIPIPHNKAVVFLHGLYQPPWIFSKIAFRMKKNFEPIFFSTPLLRFDIEKNAQILNEYLDKRDSIEQFNFIATGIGALLLRTAYSKNPRWAKKMGRCVFLSVANKGYSYLRGKENKFWFKLLFSKIGKYLLPSYMENLLPFTADYSIIYGGKENDTGFFSFLKSDNDGFLRVCDALDDNAKESFCAINRHHFKLFHDNQIKDLIFNFISTGHFGKGQRLKKDSAQIWNI